MADLDEVLLKAIFTEIDTNPAAVTLKAALNYFGWGLAPNNQTPPYMVWFWISGEEDNFMSSGADYYNFSTVQFNVVSDERSPLTAEAIASLAKIFFRNRDLTMPTGRFLQARMGGKLNQPASDINGNESVFQMDYITAT